MSWLNKQAELDKAFWFPFHDGDVPLNILALLNIDGKPYFGEFRCIAAKLTDPVAAV
ncbi:hypothetical protein KUIN1_15260 [Pseudomonas sp. KUIN-1]|nr:hypothetical protein KUIN1_15260 [Pseudomonas sp. KUIN-1]